MGNALRVLDERVESSIRMSSEVMRNCASRGSRVRRYLYYMQSQDVRLI